MHAKRKVVLLGAGRHCSNIIALFRGIGDDEFCGITDITLSEKALSGVPIIGSDDILSEVFASGVEHAFVTVGSVGDNRLRAKLFGIAREIGFQFINLNHPASTVADDLQLGVGNLIMPGVIINSSVSIGDNNILNTGAIIEHDVIIGNHVHIAPRVVLGGGVQIGDLSHIGIGATVIQGVKIGRKVLIGAGAVVIDDVPDNSIFVGVPAKLLKTKE